MSYLLSAVKQFQYYKKLGERTMDQLEDAQLFYEPAKDANSIAIIVKHLWGNMRSRWTDFLESDGEKSWRERDTEFADDIKEVDELAEKWEEGWQVLFKALMALKEEDLDRIIYIRNEGHTVVEAINRQLGHYAYHVGQIVYIGKLINGENWKSLTIPKNQSEAFNAEKFSQEKQRKHFTDE